MLVIQSVQVQGVVFTGIEINLPSTKIFIVSNDVGYIISASLSLSFFTEDTYVGGKVTEVDSIDELLEEPLVHITAGADEKGWKLGMLGKDALAKIS